MTQSLVDTTVLVEHLRQNRVATDFLKNNNPGFSTVSRAELIEGARNKNELRAVNKLCNSLAESKISEATAKLAIELMEKYCLSHGLLFLDSLLAATALEENLTFVTDNVKHFSFIPNLKLKDWKSI